jgi:hypothetical protein
VGHLDTTQVTLLALRESAPALVLIVFSCAKAGGLQAQERKLVEATDLPLPPQQLSSGPTGAAAFIYTCLLMAIQQPKTSGQYVGVELSVLTEMNRNQPEALVGISPPIRKLQACWLVTKKLPLQSLHGLLV